MRDWIKNKNLVISSILFYGFMLIIMLIPFAWDVDVILVLMIGCLGFIILGSYMFNSVFDAPKKTKEIYIEVVSFIFILLVIGGLLAGIIWKILV